MRHLELPPERLRARLFAAIAQSPSPAPRVWRRQMAFLGLSAAAWLSVAVAASGIRTTWPDRPPLPLATTPTALVLVAALSWAVGLSRGRAMVGAATEWLTGALWGLLVVLHALVIAIDCDGRGKVTFPDLVAGLSHAGPCALQTIVVALPLMASALVALRRLLMARPLLVGACLGLGAATWAHAVVWLACPVTGSGHALVAHLLPALPLMLAGALITRAAERRWLRR